MDQGEIHEEHTWAFVAQKALLILAWKTNVTTTSSLCSCKHGFASEWNKNESRSAIDCVVCSIHFFWPYRAITSLLI